jgi:curved DNA-binding protein CbpA
MQLSAYDELGVNRLDSDATIREAYLRLVKTYPPENYPERFEQIRSAYEKIATQSLRQQYQLFSDQPSGLLAIFDVLTKPGKPSFPSAQAMYQLLEEALNEQ